MTQEEIVTNTKTVLQGLEALRHEHMSIMSNLTEGKKDPDKVDIIQKNIENIELGLGEAQVSERERYKNNFLRSVFVIDLEASSSPIFFITQNIIVLWHKCQLPTSSP